MLFGQYQGDFRKKQRADYEKSQKCPQTCGFSLSGQIREQGETGSIDRHKQGEEFADSVSKSRNSFCCRASAINVGFRGQSGQVRSSRPGLSLTHLRHDRMEARPTADHLFPPASTSERPETVSIAWIGPRIGCTRCDQCGVGELA